VTLIPFVVVFVVFVRRFSNEFSVARLQIECLITYIMAASSPTHAITTAPYHQGWA
jgi:hypothetical protein